MTAQELARSLSDGGHLQGIKEINLAACYSANLGDKSFANIVAQETNLITTGYLGTMVVVDPNEMLALLEATLGYTAGAKFRSKRVVFDKAALIRRGYPSNFFSPVTFRPR